MKGKHPLTHFLLQRVGFILPPQQGQALSRAPPLQRRGREKLSPDQPSCSLLDGSHPGAVALLAKKRQSSESYQCQFIHPASPACSPASSESEQARADLGLFFLRSFLVVG